MGEFLPKLLIVDDEPKNLYTMRHVLKPLKLDIYEAESGNEALKMVLNNEFFLILMDVQMPDMNGFETASLILQGKNSSHIPIIFVTAISKTEELVLEGYESGAVDYIYKPINPQVLIGKISVFMELWKSQAQLQRYSEALERSNEELSVFAHTASHDLKAPLRHIRFFVDAILTDESNTLSEEGRGDLNVVADSAKRLSSIVDSLLEYGKVNAAPAATGRVDLNDVVNTALSDLQGIIQESAAQVSFDPLPIISGDETQMYQVFQNLLSNALKFRKPDTAPIIKLSNHNFEERRSTKYGTALCQIICEDNGIGFDDSKVDRIFTPFQRLANASQYEGSGVGMGIVKKIIENHEGSISAKSVLGEGATFIICLPLYTE